MRRVGCGSLCLKSKTSPDTKEVGNLIEVAGRSPRDHSICFTLTTCRHRHRHLLSRNSAAVDGNSGCQSRILRCYQLHVYLLASSVVDCPNRTRSRRHRQILAEERTVVEIAVEAHSATAEPVAAMSLVKHCTSQVRLTCWYLWYCVNSSGCCGSFCCFLCCFALVGRFI